MSSNEISLSDLVRYFHIPSREAAAQLGICLTSLKKICRRHGIQRWPYKRVLGRRASPVHEQPSPSSEAGTPGPGASPLDQISTPSTIHPYGTSPRTLQIKMPLESHVPPASCPTSIIHENQVMPPSSGAATWKYLSQSINVQERPCVCGAAVKGMSCLCSSFGFQSSPNDYFSNGAALSLPSLHVNAGLPSEFQEEFVIPLDEASCRDDGLSIDAMYDRNATDYLNLMQQLSLPDEGVSYPEYGSNFQIDAPAVAAASDTPLDLLMPHSHSAVTSTSSTSTSTSASSTASSSSLPASKHFPYHVDLNNDDHRPGSASSHRTTQALVSSISPSSDGFSAPTQHMDAVEG